MCSSSRPAEEMADLVQVAATEFPASVLLEDSKDSPADAPDEAQAEQCMEILTASADSRRNSKGGSQAGNAAIVLLGVGISVGLAIVPIMLNKMRGGRGSQAARAKQSMASEVPVQAAAVKTVNATDVTLAFGSPVNPSTPTTQQRSMAAVRGSCPTVTALGLQSC